MSCQPTIHSHSELVALVHAALNAFGKILREDGGKGDLSLILEDVSREIVFKSFGHEGRVFEDDPVIRQFKQSQEFKSLVAFLGGHRYLLRVLTGWPEDENLAPDQFVVLEAYVQRAALRAVLAVRYGGDAASRANMVEQFASFLESAKIHRKFSVPLYHLQLDKSSVDLGPFGCLRSTEGISARESVPDAILGRLILAKCVFEADFETLKFMAHDLSDVADELVVRISILRLMASPLISFNECHITHADPWETQFSKHAVFTRIWPAGPGKVLAKNTHVFRELQVAELVGLFENLRKFDWKQLTPWRMALNRLDEAVFKLECNSADAFLDIVIGLETLMVESDSTQESTHKVAVRTARFLESSLSVRKEVFRKVKKLYGLRSKIAHGKTLVLDEANTLLISEGAEVLGRVLRKMLQDGNTELEPSDLDLS
jgi:hypothetical protein